MEKKKKKIINCLFLIKIYFNNLNNNKIYSLIN